MRAGASNEAVAALQPFHQPVARERADVAGVPGEWLRPRTDARGTLVYLHGGSYLFGSTATHADLIARLALAADVAALSVEYRMAPEHRVYDAVADVVAVYDALLAAGHAADDLVLAGDSAGGGLVFLALVTLRDAGRPLPAAVAAIAPWGDLRCAGASFAQNERFDWGTRAVLRAQAELVAAGEPLRSPRLSPIEADLSGLPPALIHAGDAEIVRDDVVRFAETLRKAGGNVELEVWPDMVHDFHLLDGFHPAAERATNALGAFLRRHLDAAPPRRLAAAGLTVEGERCAG